MSDAAADEADVLSVRSVRRILAERELAPLHRLGQHFLVQRGIASAVADQAAGFGMPACLEVGPGLGGLTGELLSRGMRVTAVEIDRGYCAYLREAHPGGALTVVEADVLQVDAASLVDPTHCVWCGNLPYYLTGPLLRRALADPFPGYVAMVQREVGARLGAAPGTKARGRLSVMVQALCEVQRVAVVPPSAFYPRPDVESVVVRLIRRADPIWDPLAPDAERTVRAVFGHRRKGLRQALRHGLGMTPHVVESVLKRAAVDPRARAEDLTLEDLRSLSTAVGEVSTAPQGG